MAATADRLDFQSAVLAVTAATEAAATAPTTFANPACPATAATTAAVTIDLFMIVLQQLQRLTAGRKAA